MFDFFLVEIYLDESRSCNSTICVSLDNVYPYCILVSAGRLLHRIVALSMRGVNIVPTFWLTMICWYNCVATSRLFLHRFVVFTRNLKRQLLFHMLYHILWLLLVCKWNLVLTYNQLWCFLPICTCLSLKYLWFSWGCSRRSDVS